MSEEELNIGGPDRLQPTKQTDSPINVIKTSAGNIQGIFAPGDTNEEFIQKLLQTAPEQLIPWEECTLPSKGLYYGWHDGTIQVRAMGQVAEKILATQRLAQSGQSIDYLFRECCRFPDGFDPSDLLIGDRTFLLYYLRGITHGNIYEFAVTCPNTECGTTNTHVYDLNDLAQTVVWANPSLGPEPFRVDLPYLSRATGREVWVGIRFLRAVDANEMVARRKTLKNAMARPGGVRNRMAARNRSLDPRQQRDQMQTLDETISDNMEKIIVSIMGVQDPFAIRSLIEKLHSQDTAAIREWMRENTPGIDTTVEIECPNCTNSFVIELPITESFFRPTNTARV